MCSDLVRAPAAALAPFLQDGNSRTGMPGQKAKAGADPVHLQRGKKILLKAALARALLPGNPRRAYLGQKC